MESKPNYRVVAATLCILFFIASVAHIVKRFVPPAPSNPLIHDNGAFMTQAEKQAVLWRPFGDAAFREAKQFHRPIFLLVGAAWSRDGRRADRSAFADSEIDTILNSNFVPIRADIDELPEWQNGYFPLARASLGLHPGLQAYFLDEDGQLADYMAPWMLTLRDTTAVARELLASHRGGANSAALLQQVANINTLMASKPAIPNFAGELGTLQNATDSSNGGFPQDSGQWLYPEAWKYFLNAGQLELLKTSLEPVLHSSMVDWMDGGFFRLADSGDWTHVQFDKIGSVNASMASLLALYGLRVNDSVAARVAHETFDSLLGEFSRDGLLQTARIGDETPLGRSARSSFSPEDVRSFWNSGLLSPEMRAFAEQQLGLDPQSNPQMVPRVADFSQIGTPAFREALSLLRSAKQNVPNVFSGCVYADSSAFCCARLLECARLWEDSGRLQRALALRRNLELFRSGIDVTHRLHQKHGVVELTDYLGMSDACLQDFLATGNAQSLDEGVAILMQARRRFELKKRGAWLMAVGGPEGAKYLLAPEILDNLVESCTAREIRLMETYARLLEGDESHAAARHAFALSSSAAIGEFSSPAASFGLSAAGFFNASLYALDKRTAYAVGPNAVQRASKLWRMAPLKLVAPAVGMIRKDLQAKPPGFYVVGASAVEGPLSLEQAAIRLSTPSPLFGWIQSGASSSSASPVVRKP